MRLFPSLLAALALTATVLTAQTPPSAQERVSPELPDPELAPGLSYTVSVLCQINEEGQVTNAEVRNRVPERLIAPSLEAARQWVFNPATDAEGNPVAGEVIIPFRYTGLPQAVEELQPVPEYDQAPEVIRIGQLAYPLLRALSGQPVTADIIYIIDKQGQMAVAELVNAAPTAFGQAVIAMLGSAFYRPGQLLGEPVVAPLRETIQLDPNEADFFTRAQKQVIREFEKPEPVIIDLDELGEPLAPLYLVPPRYPPYYLRAGIEDTVTVRFWIAPTGHVAFAEPIDPLHPELGWAAATALRSSRFAPPFHEGRYVVARGEAEMTFSAAEGDLLARPWEPDRTPDVQAARAKAADEDRLVVMVFTDSSQDGLPRLIEEEIFRTPEWVDYVDRHVVHVHMDFADGVDKSPANAAAHQALHEKYEVKAYPAVVIERPNGTALKALTYLQGGAPAFIDEIEQLKIR